MPNAAPPPVLVLSSNRPLELAEVLAALAGQQDAAMDRRQVFLLQDGGHDPEGGPPRWSDAVMLENLDIFRRLMPDGMPLPTYLHLGPVLTRDRAERLAFEDLRAEAAVFVGDDILPGRYYLRTLDRLLDLARAASGICQVSADGEPSAGPCDPSRLVPLGHAPGRGLLRREWLRQRPYIAAYLGCGRDRAGIRALFQSWGVDASDTSYEAALRHACALTGTARLGTRACFARRLGGAEHALPDISDDFAGPAIIEQDLCRPMLPA